MSSAYKLTLTFLRFQCFGDFDIKVAVLGQNSFE